MEILFLTLLALLVGAHRTFGSNDRIVFDTDTSLYEGSQCSIKNQTGICTVIQNCPRTYLQLAKGIQPSQICGFNGTKPVVCCIDDKTDGLPIFILEKLDLSKKTKDDDNGTFEGNPFDFDIRYSTESTNKSIAVGRRAAIKCSEYRSNVCSLNAFGTMSKRASSSGEKTFHISVVGGKKSEPKEFKGAAAIGATTKNGTIKWFCGGTLISENFVLTAAHCLSTLDWGPATWVRVGDLNLERSDDDARPKNYKIAQRIKHPKYKKSTLYHDIALLRLRGSVEFNHYVAPACVDHSARPKPKKAHAIGWGKTDWANDAGSSDLLKVEISIIPHANCTRYYSDDPNLSRNIVNGWQICAGDEGKDTCQGDSGGGLIIPGSGCLQDVIGVTSFGRFCGSAVPAVYTRVSYYLAWIEQIVWPNITDN